MNLEIWIPVTTALSAGATLGLTKGIAFLLERRRSNHSAAAPIEEPRTILDTERIAVRAAARAAGFDPGQTGRFEAINSLGDMRCNEHHGCIARIDVATTKAEAASAIIEAVRTAAAAAASAASLASTTAMQLEDEVRKEGDATRQDIKDLAATIGDLRQWQGGIERAVQQHDAQITELWHEVRK